MKLLFKCNKIFLYSLFAMFFLDASCYGFGKELDKVLEMPAWTWTFAKKFYGKAHTECEYTQSTPLFTQAIISWSAKRPIKGHFVFWGQLRDAQSKQWLPKHKLMAWGKDIQQSFASIRTDSSNYYVRFEMPAGHCADAIKIEVRGVDGACVSLIKCLYINVSNHTLFMPETNKSLLNSVYIKNISGYSQMILEHPRSMHMCSPTATAMLVEFCLQKKVDPLAFALQVYDSGLDAYGSWPYTIAHANELSDGAWDFYVTRLSSFNDLYALLLDAIPVVVSVRGPLPGSATPYASGHLLLVVGYDAERQKVLCLDPAFSSDADTKVAYDYKEFIRAWEKSRRLAYKAERKVKK